MNQDANGDQLSFREVAFPFLALWLAYGVLWSAETVADTVMASVFIPNIAQGFGLDLSAAHLGIDLAKDQPDYYFRIPDYGLVGIYPVGICLLAAPIQGFFWLLAWVLGLNISVTADQFAHTRFSIEKLSATLLVSVSVVCVYRTLRGLVPQKWALCVSMVYAFGSGSVSLLAQGLWQQTGVNLINALLCYCVVSKRFVNTRTREFLFFLAVGFLVSIRPTAVVWSVCLAACFFVRFGRPSRAALVACLLGIAPSIVWNLLLFGHLLGGYGVTPVPTFDFAVLSWVERIFLIIGSPLKGLLVFNPLLVGSLFVVSARGFQRGRGEVFLILLVGELVYVVLCATNPNWHGGRGFGPRYMLDGLAIGFILAGVGLSHVARTYPKAAMGFVGLAGVYSVLVNVFGAIGSRLSDPWLVSLHQRLLMP